jgi:hemerythrin-like domain-containing protein
MHTTAILMQEHRLIEVVLSSLEEGAQRLGAGLSIDPQFFIDAAEFVSGYADSCHHGKEEDILFREMQQQMGIDGMGPVEMMLQEHDMGRRYTAGFRAAAKRLQDGDSDARQDIVDNALAFIDLLREHILKEDEILYPMAEQFLETTKQQSIDERVRQTEARDERSGLNDRYRQLAVDLQRAMS